MSDKPNRADFPFYTKYGGMSGDYGFGIASEMDKEIVAEYWPAHDPVPDFNETRKRLTACWNACIGLTLEDIERRGVCLLPVQADPSTEHAGL
jgi:hypothetical protein